MATWCGQTPPGQILSALVMIRGYCIIAVPTGIATAEITRATPAYDSTEACSSCSREGHDVDADFCKHCGAEL
jgi:voltage-gated potassium channel